KQAILGLTLHVPKSFMFGFLGKNAAGQTKPILVLFGIVSRSAGRGVGFDLPADGPRPSVEIRRRTGFVTEDKHGIDYIAADEIVAFTASFYPRWRRDLEEKYRRSFELPGARKVKALSRGTRTKLALLLALCRGADLLILDEPTSGLDPAMTEEVLQ